MRVSKTPVLLAYTPYRSPLSKDTEAYRDIQGFICVLMGIQDPHFVTIQHVIRVSQNTGTEIKQPECNQSRIQMVSGRIRVFIALPSRKIYKKKQKQKATFFIIIKSSPGHKKKKYNQSENHKSSRLSNTTAFKTDLRD